MSTIDVSVEESESGWGDTTEFETTEFSITSGSAVFEDDDPEISALEGSDVEF